ncbi:CEP41 [Bugula neritina]|uniref:CEP41 n=1 Tax=Bugula neritina TaxID=10212 RepID=A0A7J7KNV5_BUGNE|nr:CEP41 [Bugula neritina]
MSSMGVIKPRTAKKQDPMKKRIPRNPRYKDVEAVVDSGSSMTKYLKRLEEIRTNYKYKPNELFKRMKVTTFVQLIIQVSSVDGDMFFDDQSEFGDRPTTTDTELLSVNGDAAVQVDESGDAARQNGSEMTNGGSTARSTLHGYTVYILHSIHYTVHYSARVHSIHTTQYTLHSTLSRII